MNTETNHDETMFLSAYFMGLPVYAKLPVSNEAPAAITDPQATVAEKEMIWK